MNLKKKNRSGKYGIIKYVWKKEKKVKEISQEPDTPISFGMEIAWLVLKENDPQVVMDKLHCSDIKICN